METSFKFSRKLGKYIEIKYISGLSYTPINYLDYIWVRDKVEARKFIYVFCEIETHVKQIIHEHKLPIDYRLVMLMFIKNIDSISSGLSIWSNNSTEDLAHGFVRGYVSKYEEAIKFCEEMIAKFQLAEAFVIDIANTSNAKKNANIPRGSWSETPAIVLNK
jgi:hypothetical protein